MGKLSTFFYVFKNTFTSTAYYSDILKSPFSFSLKFFYLYFFLYSLIGSIVAIPKYILPLQKLVAFIPARLEEIYPAELEINVKQGKLSTNVQEPYFIPLVKLEKIFIDNNTSVSNNGELENFLTIDTKANVEDIYKYQTIVLLTQDYLVYADPDRHGELRVESLRQLDNVVVNRLMIHDFMLKMSPVINLIEKTALPAITFLVFIFLLFFVPINKLFYLLFFSLIVLVIAKIMSFSISYVKSYQIGLHFTVILTTLFGLVSLVGFGVQIPFLYTLMMIILAAVVIKKQKEITANAPPPTEVTHNPPIK
jgi:hypothetical protein